MKTDELRGPSLATTRVQCEIGRSLVLNQLCPGNRVRVKEKQIGLEKRCMVWREKGGSREDGFRRMGGGCEGLERHSGTVTHAREKRVSNFERQWPRLSSGTYS